MFKNLLENYKVTVCDIAMEEFSNSVGSILV